MTRLFNFSSDIILAVCDRYDKPTTIIWRNTKRSGNKTDVYIGTYPGKNPVQFGMTPSIDDLHTSKQFICNQAVQFMECAPRQLFTKLDHLLGPTHKSSPNPSISPTSPRSPETSNWVLPIKPKSVPVSLPLRKFASPCRAEKLQTVPKEVLTIESFIPVRRISRVKTAKFSRFARNIPCRLVFVVDGSGYQVTLLYNEDFNLFDVSANLVKSTIDKLRQNSPSKVADFEKGLNMNQLTAKPKRRWYLDVTAKDLHQDNRAIVLPDVKAENYEKKGTYTAALWYHNESALMQPSDMKVKFFGDGTEELTCHPNGDLYNCLLRQISDDKYAKIRVKEAFEHAKKVESIVAKNDFGNSTITMAPEGVQYFNVVPEETAALAENNLSIDVYDEEVEESSYQCFDCGKCFTSFIGLQRHSESEGHDFKSLSVSMVPNIYKFFAPGPADVLCLVGLLIEFI